MNWIPYVQMAERAKDNLPEGSLKYLFVYLKVRIFKCSYHIYIYLYLLMLKFQKTIQRN